VPDHWERRQTYEGTVEIWASGAKQQDANIRLSGYVKVSVVPTIGPDQIPPMDGVQSWDGEWVGLTEASAMALIAEPLELRFRNGVVGKARLDGTGGRLKGFDVIPDWPK
jgi:hypothetical protein